jgi:hypothetical protein
MELYLDKYTLNLTKLKLEDERTREFIQQIYNEMIGIYRDYCIGHYPTKDASRLMVAHYNTLYYNGYILDVRDIKLDEILKK